MDIQKLEFYPADTSFRDILQVEGSQDKCTMFCYKIMIIILQPLQWKTNMPFSNTVNQFNIPVAECQHLTYTKMYK